MRTNATNRTAAERLEFVRWQIKHLYSARSVSNWSAADAAQYEALIAEERNLLEAL
jgi:hypothetical protein